MIYEGLLVGPSRITLCLFLFKYTADRSEWYPSRTFSEQRSVTNVKLYSLLIVMVILTYFYACVFWIHFVTRQRCHFVAVASQMRVTGFLWRQNWMPQCGSRAVLLCQQAQMALVVVVSSVANHMHQLSSAFFHFITSWRQKEVFLLEQSWASGKSTSVGKFGLAFNHVTGHVRMLHGTCQLLEAFSIHMINWVHGLRGDGNFSRYRGRWNLAREKVLLPCWIFRELHGRSERRRGSRNGTRRGTPSLDSNRVCAERSVSRLRRSWNSSWRCTATVGSAATVVFTNYFASKRQVIVIGADRIILNAIIVVVTAVWHKNCRWDFVWHGR